MSYNTFETSQRAGQPVEVYDFAMGTVHWRYTSSDGVQAYGGHNFLPIEITRGEIDTSDEDQQGSLEVTVPMLNDVAALFIPGLPAKTVTLTVYRFHRGDAEVVPYWIGEIAGARFTGSEARLTGIPISRALRRQLPGNTYQSQCNWRLFSPQCGLAKATYAVAATLTAVSGLTITAAAFAAHADGYFNNGWVEIASGETHWVVAHVGNTLTLLTPFIALSVGASVTAYPGCNRTLAACATFSNLQHHCGFSFPPTSNPFEGGLF